MKHKQVPVYKIKSNQVPVNRNKSNRVPKNAIESLAILGWNSGKAAQVRVLWRREAAPPAAARFFPWLGVYEIDLVVV
jgi:hypothetical protein